MSHHCSNRAKFGLTLFAALMLAGLSACSVLRSVERPLVFYPARYPDGNWQPAGLNFEDAWFTAADGPKLHGWYVPHERARAVVLFAHGNAGNITHRAELLRELHDRMRVSTLVFDYRGYGRSEGKPDEQGVLADARAARAWLAAHAGIPKRQIVLMGESLGGGVAVDLAAADGARGLVLVSTFSSIPDVAAAHVPWLPAHALTQIRLDSAAKIPNYHDPLLQFHGDDDHIIPIDSARRLFAAANQPKRLVVIPGGDHNDPPTPAFFAALDEFLDALK